MNYARLAARTAVLVSLLGISFLVASSASAQVTPPPLPEPPDPGLIRGLLDHVVALVQRLLDSLL